MPSYIQLMPEFAFSEAERFVSMRVAEGVLKLTIKPAEVIFELVKVDGAVLSNVLMHQQTGAMPVYVSSGSGNPHVEDHRQHLIKEFQREFVNDAEKLRGGMIITNIGAISSDHMKNVNNKTALDLQAGQVTKFKPFPKDLPDFTVGLKLVAQ